MKNKKIAIILISVVAAAALMVGGIIVLSEASASTLDITDEVAGYYVISVNPAVEIAVGAGGNVISVSGQNDDGKEILTGSDFSGMWAGEAIERVLGLIREAGYLGSSGFYDEITIGYFSDAGEKSKDEILALVPEEYRDICIVTALTGNAAQRSGVSLKAPLDTTMATTSASSDTPGITPDATDTPEPSPSGTPEETGTSSKKNGSGSDDGVINPRFDLSVSISGGNAVFTWTKLKYVNFSRIELRCVPKATSTWKEDTPKVIKTITGESTTSCSVSISSLGFKGVGHELFFYLDALDEDPKLRDSDNGSYPTYVSTHVSITKMADGSYKVNNNNPSVFGYGEVGVDYLPPTMSISETSGTLLISWQYPNPMHEDFKGVELYVSESSAVPANPDSFNGNCRNFSKDNTSYYLDVADFYSLTAGKTYYFTLYSLYGGGGLVAGNTIKATIPVKKDTAFVNVWLNTLKELIYIYWTDAVGSNIEKYRLVIEYKDAGDSGRTPYYTNSWMYQNCNQNGKFETWWPVDFVPARTYYISLYTKYTDGSEKFGNEVAVVIPGEAPTATPTAVTTEEPTATPTETATETPTEAPSEEPTPSPAEEPTPTPTETDSGGTEG